MNGSRDFSVGVVIEACVLGLVSIAMSVSFLVFNVRLRHTRVIKMSSPSLNVVIASGGILASVGCLTFGMDYFLENDYSAMSTLCQMRVITIVLSSSLVFGPMFTKAWRVYKIFQQAATRKVVIRDNKLFLIISAILVCDVTVLVVWQSIDPLHWTTSLVTSQILPDAYYNVSTQDVLAVHWCTSRDADIWVAGLFTFKVVVMLYGLYLAWQVRNVTLPAMNDANPIIVTSLTTMVMATFASSVTMMLRARPNAVYACLIFAVWFSNMVAMMAVFLPKIRQWKKTPDGSQFRVSIASGNVTSGLQTFDQVEEELYHMVKENISLQKSLQEKNEDIQTLQKHLDNAQEKLTQIKVNQEAKQDSGLDLSSSVSQEEGCEITVLGTGNYSTEKCTNNMESYESYVDMNGTASQSCRKAKRPSSLYSIASLTSLSKLSKLKAAVDDASTPNTLSSCLQASCSADLDRGGKHHGSWMYDSLHSRKELAGAIAKSYNLEDNCDTYSYVSSYLPSSSSLFHGQDPFRYRCSSEDSLTTLANDRLYPECSKQRREARNEKRHTSTHDAGKRASSGNQQKVLTDPLFVIQSDAHSRPVQHDTIV